MQGTPGSRLAWKTMRPIRPNPLMPILTAIAMSTMGHKFTDGLESRGLRALLPRGTQQ